MKKDFININRFCVFLTAIITAITLIIPVNAETANNKAQTPGTFILSVEAFTVGYGFIIEPKEIPYLVGDSIYDAVKREIGTNNLNYGQDLGNEIVSVPADSAWVSIIDKIKETLEDKNIHYNNNIAQNGWLSQHDFVSTSGWYTTVNNAPLKTELNNTAPTANSVVRIQFSVYGNGADINQSSGAFGTDTAAPVFAASNRDELYKNIATYTKDGIIGIGDSIMEIAVDLSAPQTDINKALENLKDAIQEIDPDEFDEIEDDDDDTDTDTDNGDPAETSSTNGVDSDTDNNGNSGIPSETQGPPAETTPVTTNSSDLPYIPDDGKGSGNLPKEDSAPTGVDVTASIGVMIIAGFALPIIIRLKKKYK